MNNSISKPGIASVRSRANLRRPGRAQRDAIGGWIEDNEVALWRATLEDQPADVVRLMHALLSPDEVERARRFYFDRDRRRFVVARGILRMLISRYAGGEPEDHVLQYGANGKPSLAAETSRGCPLYFNVAHSEGLALYAFTRAGEIGVDLERIRDLPDWESIAELSFSPPELARLRACPPEQQREQFFRAWTRQEAVLKALGTGLVSSTQSAAVATQAFRVHPLNIAPGYAAALAAAPAARWSAADLVRVWPEDGRTERRRQSATAATPFSGANFP